MVRNNISKYRTQAGLTQKGMALETNMAYRAIQYWEAQERQPSAEQLLKLAQYFNCKVDDLIYLVPEEE